MNYESELKYKSERINFIVAIDKSIENKTSLKCFYGTLTSMIDIYTNYNHLIKSEKDMLKIINDIYNYNELQTLTDNYTLQLYKEIIKYLNNDYKIYFISNIKPFTVFYKMLCDYKKQNSKLLIIKEI